MSSQIKLAIDQLAVQVKTASIKKVEISNEDLDMTLYTDGQLPLIQLKLGEINLDYEKSSAGHALWHLFVGLTCYFLDDIDEVTQRETLEKEIMDAIGADSELDGKAVDVDIDSVKYEGEFPLWKVVMELDIIYEKGIDDA